MPVVSEPDPRHEDNLNSKGSRLISQSQADDQTTRAVKHTVLRKNLVVIKSIKTRCSKSHSWNLWRRYDLLFSGMKV